MKQLFQNLKNGSTDLLECPCPQCRKGSLLIRTQASLVSLGTEKMLVQFSKSGLLDKARQQPEKVKEVLDKIKSDGLSSTLQAINNKLDEPLPLGYCNAGIVLEVGKDVTDYSVGDRVVSNGPHAEIVSVSKNLVTRIPDGISFEEAAFTVAGAIGLQGIRLSAPTLGETAVIIGLGLIGQLTAQLAKAHGYNVIAFDLDCNKTELAKKFGILSFVSDVPVQTVLQLTNGTGADCVIITASSPSESIISQSAKMCRKRGRIVLVGVIPLNINRSDFYEKELSFQVSCSYGPGRYDPEYELSGKDYPLPFVRWTEKRNFDAVLHCMTSGTLHVKPLISEKVQFDDTPSIYSNLSQSKSIATIIEYSRDNSLSTSRTINLQNINENLSKAGKLAIIGSGNFTKMALLPVLHKINAPIGYICSQSGTSASYLAQKYKIPLCTTDLDQVLNDANVKSIFITTRHKSHADLCIQALKKGKHVFVEKPLATNREQLQSISSFLSNTRDNISLTVGFNRRYSPLVDIVKDILGNPPPMLNMIYTMNAGPVPQSHWLQTADEGGRIIGEACHCIDLFVYIAASPVVSVCAASLGNQTNLLSDNVSILLKAKNGSLGVINYYSNGSKQYSKEKIEIFSVNSVISIDNFKSLKVSGKNFKIKKLFNSDKGHFHQFKTYLNFLDGKSELRNTISEHLNVTEASIAAIESLNQNKWVDLSYIW
jgi:predicted dehydrogenase/threonine dehydrogenase-like Zn-dependent dehydrogenase